MKEYYKKKRKQWRYITLTTALIALAFVVADYIIDYVLNLSIGFNPILLMMIGFGFMGLTVLLMRRYDYYSDKCLEGND